MTNINSENLKKNESWVPALCEFQCVYGPCMLRVRVVDGVAVGMEPNGEENFKELSKNHGVLCPKAYGLIQKIYDPNRIKGPMKRTNPEKGPGIDPGWVEISWEEALDTIAEKIRKVRSEDTARLAQCGPGTGGLRSCDTWWLFFSLLGPSLSLLGGESNKCGLMDHQWGNRWHGAMGCEPDVYHCNYMLLFGKNTSGFGASAESYIYADARERGMKTVYIDPVYTQTAAKADEYVPIKPGTDIAFFLAMINIIVNEKETYDDDFLKQMSNAPYLIDSSGRFVRDPESGKVLVWDAMDNKARAYDEAVKDYSLTGVHEVEGVECKPAFQTLKDHIAQYTPEWAESVTEIDAATIRRITSEFIEQARIGSTVTIDGVTLPYRPVAIRTGRSVNGVMHSYHAVLALHIIAVLMGSLEVPGGHAGGHNMSGVVQERDGISFTMDPFTGGVKPGPDGMVDVHARPITWPPITYGGVEALAPFSAYPRYPEPPFKDPSEFHNGILRHIEWVNLADPPEGMPAPEPPEVLIRFRMNPLMTMGRREVVEKALKKIPFIVSISYTEDEMTDFSDIMLPEQVELEKFLLMANTRTAANKKHFQIALQQPVVKQSHNARNLNEIFMELSERLGTLDELNLALNGWLRLIGPYKLETGRKYSWEEVVDRQCKSLTKGKYDLEWFKKHGGIAHPVTAEEQYDIHLYMRQTKLRYYLPYMETVKKAGEDLNEKHAAVGIDWWNTEEYAALPEYFEPQLEASPAEYNFYCANPRVPTESWGSNSALPWIHEIGEHVAGRSGIVINQDTAKKLDIGEGELVCVESEFGLVKQKAILSPGCRPDCVLIYGQGGHWKTPIAKDANRVSHSSLLPTSYKWTDKVSGGMQSAVIKCKVYKV